VSIIAKFRGHIDDLASNEADSNVNDVTEDIVLVRRVSNLR